MNPVWNFWHWEKLGIGGNRVYELRDFFGAVKSEAGDGLEDVAGDAEGVGEVLRPGNGAGGDDAVRGGVEAADELVEGGF